MHRSLMIGQVMHRAPVLAKELLMIQTTTVEGLSSNGVERQRTHEFSHSVWRLVLAFQFRSLSTMPHVWRTRWLLTSEFTHWAGTCCMPDLRNLSLSGRRIVVKEVCRHEFRQLETHHLVLEGEHNFNCGLKKKWGWGGCFSFLFQERNLSV